MRSTRVGSFALVTTLGMAVMGVGACFEPEPGSEHELGEEQQESTSDQGGDYQGGDYQGGDYQGGDYQGGDYQGSDFAGATLGGVSLASGTKLHMDRALTVWRLLRTWPRKYEQRFPDRICTWDETKTVLEGCQTVALATAPSPLAGVTFPAAFTRDGQTFVGAVRIKSGVGSVQNDGSMAMHALNGHQAFRWYPKGPTTTCTYYAYGVGGCENWTGCRANCDLWTYDLELVNADGTTDSFCPQGQRAYAVPGTYAANGAHTGSTTQFTFACQNGTIAKCTKWGYRSWGQAQKNDNSFTSLWGYHQSCVRAAAADYCANGHSFTKNGTLIDIYDYYNSGGVGLVRSTKDISGGSVYQLESGFDRHGAHQIDHMRYQELAGADAENGIHDETVGCPGRFIPGSDDLTPQWVRDVNVYEDWESPTVWVDSTTTCSHSERTVGKWLDERCGHCDEKLPAYCTDPTNPAGWDANCVYEATKVGTQCTGYYAPLTSHSECSTGSSLPKLATGCTLRVCRDKPWCCGSSLGWNSTCRDYANAHCRGGQENPISNTGFCGDSIVLPPTL